MFGNDASAGANNFYLLIFQRLAIFAKLLARMLLYMIIASNIQI